MSNLITPPPSDAARLAELNRRFRFRLWQMIVTMVTLILTFWFFTLGVVFGIAFLFLAKHILVGVLAAGLHYPPRDKPVAPGYDDGVMPS